MQCEHHDSPTVFVYGTLRPQRANFRLIEKFVDDAQRARLPRYQLWALPEGYPAGIEGDGHIVGTLLTLTDPTEAWRRMDRLEGYRPDAHNPLYRPRNIEVYPRQTDACLPTWAYVACERRCEEIRRRGRLIDHGDWNRWSDERER